MFTSCTLCMSSIKTQFSNTNKQQKHDLQHITHTNTLSHPPKPLTGRRQLINRHGVVHGLEIGRVQRVEEGRGLIGASEELGGGALFTVGE